jgi:hypothetical protein
VEAVSPTDIRQPWRLGARGDRWLDIGLVVLLVLPVPFYVVSELPWWALLSLGQALPLLGRRRYPDAAFAAVALASALQVPLLQAPLHTQLAFPVAVYSVARWSTPVAGAAALSVGVAAAAVASVDWIVGFDGALRPRNFVPYFLTVCAFVVAAWALGTLARTRRAYVDALVERGEQIRRDAEQRVALAASAERAPPACHRDSRAHRRDRSGRPRRHAPADGAAACRRADGTGAAAGSG